MRHRVTLHHICIFNICLPDSIQSRGTIGPPTKRHWNGDLQAGRWWPTFICLLCECPIQVWATRHKLITCNTACTLADGFAEINSSMHVTCFLYN